MARQLLNLSTLHEIPNGEDAIAEFDRLIRLCASDCGERIEIKKPRKVLLQLSFEPDENQVLVSIATKHVMPPKESGLARGSLDKSGKLFVNPVSVDDPEQRTLDEAGQ